MPQHKRTIRALFSLLTPLLLLPGLLHAAEQQRWYQVEVIIYAQNNTDYHNSEIWPIDYTLPQLEGSRELSHASTTAEPQPFSLLKPEALQLGGAAARIKRASDVDLVLHFGWLQPGLEEKQAVAIHVYDKMLESSATAAQDGALPQLDGTLRLILSRYLHLESDLIWRDPISEEELARLRMLPTFGNNETLEGNNEEGSDVVTQSLPADPLPLLTHHVYRMEQSRRMRSNELHYIDHPRFGIIAIANRYEPQQEKPAE